jgi:predicted phosphate transport protein (TIGR00153 family)
MARAPRIFQFCYSPGATIRQIAVLPYRRTGDALDAPVEVLLVTSRRTRRWVVPKGGRIKGLPPHAAAAQEAWEEAGLLGAVCPTPLGHFEYRKNLTSGASRMVEVDLFPFAVTDELTDWPEAAERERRWFPLAEAVEAVSDDSLRPLLRGFRAQDFTHLSNGNAWLRAVRSMKEGFRMFHWFQGLLPRQGRFFDLFEAHAATIVAGSGALARMLQGGAGMADHVREISEREHEADGIIREVLQSVRRTFLTPFDRGAISSLISAMDDSIDQMQQTAAATSIYGVTEFEQEMRDMAAIIVDSARLIAEALPMLRDVHANAARLHELTERLVRMEGDADKIHDAGLKKAFKTHGESAPMKFFVAREIYSHLEKVVDRFEDVANEIDGLVIDHA